MGEMNARKIFGVAALRLATRPGIVALSGSNRIGHLLGGRAGKPGPDPTITLGIRSLATHARQEAGAPKPAFLAEATLSHEISRRDALGHAARAGVLDLLS